MAVPVYVDMSTTTEDLRQILELQRQNLPHNISPEEAREQGFVTIEHDLETLQALSRPYGHTVARRRKLKPDADSDGDGDNNCGGDIVVGYALTMLPEHRDLVPFLQPILEEIETVTFDGKLVRDLNYCIMGQVCVAKNFRGRGIF